MLHAALGQHACCQMGIVEPGLITKHLQVANGGLLVIEIEFFANQFQLCMAVTRDAAHPRLVDGIALRIAFPQPAREPAPLMRIDSRREFKRRVRTE